jgi:hypothetical protein
MWAHKGNKNYVVDLIKMVEKNYGSTKRPKK